MLPVGVLLIALGANPAAAATPAFGLAGYYGDNMLFQREVPMVLHGWAEPGEQVEVNDGRAPVTVQADRKGRWRALLPPRAAAESIDIRVTSGDRKIKLSNVAVGELWFASGQSNMGWPMGWIVERSDDIAKARYPQVRMMSAPPAAWRDPRDDLDAVWYPATPQTVREFSATAYHFARALHQTLKVPVGVINASWGGTRIEPWMRGDEYLRYSPAHAHVLENLHNQAFAPAALFNGMVHPFTPLSIRGVLWYQGESNLNEGQVYLPKFEALIHGWRQAWSQPRLPFLYAQVAPMNYAPYSPDKRSEMLPEFWEMQVDALRIPETGMITTVDLNPSRNLHPPEKREVGERFAALAHARVYKAAVLAESPRYARHQVEGSTVRVEWTSAQGLRASDGAALREFEVAGSDGVFHPAAARIDGETVLVSAPQVSRPVRVRYAWHSVPEPNLVNAAGLPAIAFRAPR